MERTSRSTSQVFAAIACTLAFAIALVAPQVAFANEAVAEGTETNAATSTEFVTATDGNQANNPEPVIADEGQAPTQNVGTNDEQPISAESEQGAADGQTAPAVDEGPAAVEPATATEPTAGTEPAAPAEPTTATSAGEQPKAAPEAKPATSEPAESATTPAKPQPAKATPASATPTADESAPATPAGTHARRREHLHPRPRRRQPPCSALAAQGQRDGCHKRHLRG